MTTAFHPQSDGQAEATNKIITMYLRCFTGDRPRQWLRWLPWAEYTYNTAFQTSLRETPFKLVYGREPPTIRSYEAGDSRVAAVAKTMEEHDELLADVRSKLEQAQSVYKSYYDRRHRQETYTVGDWVWLRVRHRTPLTLQRATSGKLCPRYYGPYQVIEIINEVPPLFWPLLCLGALQLPLGARIHDVFHIGLLKRFNGQPPESPPPLPPMHHCAAIPVPAAAVKARLARGVRQVLIQWQGQPASAASWEDVDSFVQRYLQFQLADELLVEGGRDVMWGKTYFSRGKNKAGQSGQSSG